MDAREARIKTLEAQTSENTDIQDILQYYDPEVIEAAAAHRLAADANIAAACAERRSAAQYDMRLDWPITDDRDTAYIEDDKARYIADATHDMLRADGFHTTITRVILRNSQNNLPVGHGVSLLIRW